MAGDGEPCRSKGLFVGLTQIFSQTGHREYELVCVHRLEVPPFQNELVARVGLAAEAPEGSEFCLLRSRPWEVPFGDKVGTLPTAPQFAGCRYYVVSPLPDRHAGELLAGRPVLRREDVVIQLETGVGEPVYR